MLQLNSGMALNDGGRRLGFFSPVLLLIFLASVSFEKLSTEMLSHPYTLPINNHWECQSLLNDLLEEVL